MTKAKHTPGPWSIEIARNGWNDNEYIIGADGSFVAQAQWTNDNQHENARLIAAAPELLEALKNAQALYPCAMYAEAIAKATGE